VRLFTPAITSNTARSKSYLPPTPPSTVWNHAGGAVDVEAQSTSGRSRAALVHRSALLLRLAFWTFSVGYDLSALYGAHLIEMRSKMRRTDSVGTGP